MRHSVMRHRVTCLVACWSPLLILVSGLAVADDLRLVEAARNQDRDAIRALL
jgi:hypothetical protein